MRYDLRKRVKKYAAFIKTIAISLRNIYGVNVSQNINAYLYIFFCNHECEEMEGILESVIQYWYL